MSVECEGSCVLRRGLDLHDSGVVRTISLPNEGRYRE